MHWPAKATPSEVLCLVIRKQKCFNSGALTCLDDKAPHGLLSHLFSGPGNLEKASFLFGKPQKDVAQGHVCQARKVHQQVYGPCISSSRPSSSATWAWLDELGSHTWVSPQRTAVDKGQHFGFACNGTLLLAALQFDWTGEITGMRFTTKWDLCRDTVGTYIIDRARGPDAYTVRLTLDYKSHQDCLQASCKGHSMCFIIVFCSAPSL